MKNNTSRVMVLWHANPNPFSPPILFENQITGVLEEYVNLDFKFGSDKFSIPRGEFDLELLLHERNLQKPDYLFVCIDSTTPYFPRNIDKVCKNSFLCFGDSHHLQSPISRLLRYVANEKYNGHIFTNNVRHAHWFKKASDAEQFFEPGLFALNLKSHCNSTTEINSKKDLPIIYGQIGNFHPRRRRIAPDLIKNKLIKHVFGSEKEIAIALQNSLACVNITLNSDLNSRVFEIAQTGCLLIMDKLSVMNGHGSVLIPGHNCIVFNEENELIEILEDYQYLQSSAKAIGENLKHEHDTFWGIEPIKTRFSQSLYSDSIKFNPIPLINKKSIEAENSSSLYDLLPIYETVLEIHKEFEYVEILIDPNLKCNELFSDLPRVKLINSISSSNRSGNIRLYITEDENEKKSVYQITN